MKRFFIIIASLIFPISIYANSTYDTAILWMFENGLTKFKTSQEFMVDKPIRRDEAAKFFVQYSKNILKKNPDNNKKECDNFLDLEKGWPDLNQVMKESCKLSLFKGNNGKFLPNETLTNGQAITVLVRLVDGNKDESQGHFATKYFERAKELGLITNDLLIIASFDSQATRGNLGLLLYNASKLKNQAVKNTLLFPQCKQIQLTPFDRNIYTGYSYSGMFTYSNDAYNWIVSAINTTNNVMECSSANSYLREQLTLAKAYRKKVVVGYISEMKEQIRNNNLYINAINSPNTTVLYEYNTCISYNAKVAINNALGADTTPYKNCGRDPYEVRDELLYKNQTLQDKIDTLNGIKWD